MVGPPYSRPQLKPLLWIGSSREDLKGFPEDVQDDVGYALFVAQRGEKDRRAKPLKGMGSGVLEVVAQHDGNAYRAVYLARFPEAIYVLHAFQKKSKRGATTPLAEMETVRRRFRTAEERRHAFREASRGAAKA